MAKPDGRVEAGQSLKRAISAQRWNDLCDAADIVHGRRGGTKGTPNNGRSHLLAKTSGVWIKGSMMTLNIYSGQPLNEQVLSDQVTAFNKFADIENDRWVMLASIGGSWYLIAAECDV